MDPSGRFYLVDVSIDGGNVVSDTGSLFTYYEQPVVESVSPNRGPVKGGT
jgi:hypothetical protein